MKAMSLFSLIAAAFLWTGCHSGFDSEQELTRFINNPENGLMKTKDVGELRYSAKILPAEFLALRELKSMEHTTECTPDSLVDLYDNAVTILFSIGPTPARSEADVMLAGVTDIGDFKERAMALNFEVQDRFTLKTAEGELKPTLMTLENSYGLHSHRNLYLVFAPTHEQCGLLEANQFELTYEDDIFNTGINHFLFKKEAIDKLPKVKFWTNYIS